MTGSRYVISALLTAKLNRQTKRASWPAYRLQPIVPHRHLRHFDRGAEALQAGAPGFRPVLPPRLEHRVVDFLELHARPAHPDERDERGEHFVAAFADLVDPRVAQHSA